MNRFDHPDDLFLLPELSDSSQYNIHHLFASYPLHHNCFRYRFIKGKQFGRTF